MACENSYNKFYSLDGGISAIFDYLFNNASDMWKLLKYTSPNDFPFTSPEVTSAEKAAMICNNPADYYNADVVARKNILFQKYNDEEYSVATPQVRMWIDDVVAINSYTGYANIVFQIVVPNKQNQFNGGQMVTSDRTLELFKAICRTLNGTQIPSSNFNSPLFLNKSAPDGAGRATGAYRERENKNYSGYNAVFSVLI